MIKELFFGLDLSLNCTGICIYKIVDDIPEKIAFYRIMFDPEKNKTGKVYNPVKIEGVNDRVYRMPKNINLDSIVLNNEYNATEQNRITLKAIIASTAINKIIGQYLLSFKPDSVVFTIENYIMPSFGGKNSLMEVSSLITLQGYIREFIVKTCIGIENLNWKLYCPTASQNKKFFCQDGNADKIKMIDTFYKYYDGDKLIPYNSTGKLDDIIDSFSLMINGYVKFKKIPVFQEAEELEQEILEL